MTTLARLLAIALVLVAPRLAHADPDLAQGKFNWFSDQDTTRPVSLAFDGNTNPEVAGKSIGIVKRSASGRAFVVVDLGESRQIGQVVVHNTHEACASPGGGCELTNAQVLVSELIIQESDFQKARPTVTPLWFSAGSTSAGQPSSMAVLDFSRRGRYVALFSPAFEIHLAELQVFEARHWARGRSRVSQSSTSGSGTALRANDGNVAGQAVAAGGTLPPGGTFASQTTNQVQPWWNVDLDAVQPIRQIDIWPATNYAFPGATLFVSDRSLDRPLNTLVNDPFVYAFTLPAGAGVKSIAVNQRARFVRIQIPSTTASTLALAEVQVWAVAPGAVDKRVVAQSSVSRTIPAATADKAVDGNVDGNLAHGFGIATEPSATGAPTPWWQIDLGAIKDVRAINLWNRTDCCQEKLTDFFVIGRVKTPFAATDTVAKLATAPDTYVWAIPKFSVGSSMISLPLNVQLRYLRIQKFTSDALSFAEAEIVTREGFMTTPSFGQTFDTPKAVAVANRYNQLAPPTITFSGYLPLVRPLDTLTLEFNDCDRGFDGRGLKCDETTAEDDTRWRELATLSSFPGTPKLTPYSADLMVPWSVTFQVTSDFKWHQGGVASVRAVRRTIDASTPELPIVLAPVDAAGDRAPYDSRRTPLVSMMPSPGTETLPDSERPRFLDAGWNTPAPSDSNEYKLTHPYYKQLHDVEGIPIVAQSQFEQLYLSGSGTVRLDYYNKGDLGVYRKMRCGKRGSEVGCLVSNYLPYFVGQASPLFGPQDRTPSPALPNDGSLQLLASVAMISRPTFPAGTPNKVVFYVFDGSKRYGMLDPTNGEDGGNEQYLLSSIKLDNQGNNKTVPGNCVTCHGGSAGGTNFSVTDAHFLPFDFAAIQPWPGQVRDAAMEETVRKLNAMVYDSDPGDPLRQLLNGIYQGDVKVAGRTQLDSWAPADWSRNKRDNAFYQNVLHPFCRTCHLSNVNATLNFLAPASVNALKPMLISDVCKEHHMPNAERTNDELWHSAGRAHILGWFGLNADQCWTIKP
jgi:hypothetical protein